MQWKFFKLLAYKFDYLNLTVHDYLIIINSPNSNVVLRFINFEILNAYRVH